MRDPYNENLPVKAKIRHVSSMFDTCPSTQATRTLRRSSSSGFHLLLPSLLRHVKYQIQWHALDEINANACAGTTYEGIKNMSDEYKSR